MTPASTATVASKGSATPPPLAASVTVEAEDLLDVAHASRRKETDAWTRLGRTGQLERQHRGRT